MVQKSEKIRIGFLFPGLNSGWLGGVHYFRNLIAAIETSSAKSIEPVVVVASDLAENIVSDAIPCKQILKVNSFRKFSFSWLVDRVCDRILGFRPFLTRELAKNNIDLVSHYMGVGPFTKIQTLGWIPDFQHLHLPDFFRPQELSTRDRIFTKVANECERVILSSENAKKDFEMFSPENRGKATVLNFAVDLGNIRQDFRSREDLEKEYGFVGDYIFLPNQFWAHKNHILVIEAVAHLQREGKSVQVLATGNTEDFRQPGHFQKLKMKIAELGVTENFRVLGVVPVRDLYSLMFHAAAVLNPSLFEGWSTTVEEARAMGKTIVLSDIEVHKEQAPEYGIYFTARDHEDLAEKLAFVLERYDREIDLERIRDAEEKSCVRMQQFGVNYESLVLSAYQQVRRV